MTQLAQKLREAGFETPEDKLRALIRTAVRNNPRDFQAAREAVLYSCRRDIDLLFALVWKFATGQTEERLRAAYNAMNAEKAKHEMREGTDSVLNTGKRMSPARGEGGDQPLSDGQEITVAPQSLAFTTIVRLSLLDTVQVDGVAIGKCTPNQVRTWLRKRNKESAWAERMIANLPPDRPIGEFITADDADKLWEEIGP